MLTRLFKIPYDNYQQYANELSAIWRNGSGQSNLKIDKIASKHASEKIDEEYAEEIEVKEEEKNLPFPVLQQAQITRGNLPFEDDRPLKSLFNRPKSTI